MESAIVQYHKLHIIKENKKKEEKIESEDEESDSDFEEVHEPKRPKTVTFAESSLFSSPSKKVVLPY